MKFDIINTDYLRSLKPLSPYYQIMVWLALLINILTLLNIDVLGQNSLANTISTCIVIVYFLIVLLNAVLYTRIGQLEFSGSKIVLDKMDKRSEFLLSNIKLVEINKVQYKHYSIEAKPYFKEVIELNENDLSHLKTFFHTHQIECRHKSIIHWFKSMLQIKNRT